MKEFKETRNQIGVSDSLQKLARERIIPTPEEEKVYAVEILHKNGMLIAFSEVELAAIKDKVESTGGKVPESWPNEYVQDKDGNETLVKEGVFYRYVKTIIVSRIGWVNGTPYVVHPNDPVAVPAFISNVCMSMGKALETGKGITLYPIVSTTAKKCVSKNGDKVENLIETYDLLSKDEMLRVSAFLRAIPGYDYGKGYVKDKSGSFDFMSMQCLENDVIMHHDDEAHPVYALLASVVQPHLLASVLSPLVRYGNCNHMKHLLWEVTSL